MVSKAKYRSKKMWQAMLLLLLFQCAGIVSFAQGNQAARYEIEAKRMGVKPTDKDALPRSREFIRLDSTYYVGWMYEGIYKYDRSADYLGYKNAIPALEKALRLMDKDYGNTLKNMYSSIMFFAQNVPRYQDLFSICGALQACYDNIEMPDSVMALLDKIDKYRFRKDFFGVYYHRAWTYHRNRFYTSEEHPFLGNSIEANEKKAFDWCYKGLGFVDRNRELNEQWFGPGQAQRDKQIIYHYLALLHCYNKNYDSSEYYYERLREGGGISYNNYANMQHEVGKFENAIEYFTIDLNKSYLRMLREPYYYLPELHVYGGRTKEAIKMNQQIIASVGSTPGFGWYNISLARGYMYDGQLDSCEEALNKAANFKELHIGTTLTQSQYDFTINLLKVQLIDRKIARVKFLNKNWWYSPSALYDIASLKVAKLMAEYVVVNELAFNPERNRLVYDLFCSEATTSFDEAWYLLKDFSPKYFKEKYETYQQKDTRENLQRYFQLFTAKFKWEAGNKSAAREDLDRILNTAVTDTANEKLFTGRLFEGLSKAYEKDGRQSTYGLYRSRLFESYPQLIPFSGIKMQVMLNTAGVDDEITKQVIEELKDANIEWVNANDGYVPVATVTFNKRGNKYEALINVRSGTNKPVVAGERIIFSKPAKVGGEIALRLFGKGGALVFEPPAEKGS
ncbi:tetratricopeptide repeat protein [Foetidibacter luteolus]|uniref:tetratricopeptide repeat protein n=1 Tax=Foetidibacter luteolus TaxID=2608880 RepID=UPI00129B8C71|nr:tetratricopeptide repeat protein [Foetidibacter luteolus]